MDLSLFIVLALVVLLVGIGFYRLQADDRTCPRCKNQTMKLKGEGNLQLGRTLDKRECSNCGHTEWYDATHDK